MPDSLTEGTAPVKQRRDNKTDIRWSDDELDRIEATIAKLADETHAEITLAGLIRGSVMRRCDEVLGSAA